MSDFAQVRKAKEDAEAQLRKLGNVHAVGIGKKKVAGRYLDEICIAILVDRKLPLDQLSPADVVPPEIEGIPTDVLETPRPRNLMAPNPSNLVATVNDPLNVTFSGQNTPGAGLVVVLEYTSGPQGQIPNPARGLLREYSAGYHRVGCPTARKQHQR